MPVARAAQTRQGWWRWLAEQSDKLGPLVTLVALVAIFALRTEHFWEMDNLRGIGQQTATIAIVAIGETIVIISAGIDLSVGRLAVLAGICAALGMKADLPLALSCAIGIAVGLLVGLLNGALTASVNMPSFVVTLGMMGICRGVSLLLAKGQTISGLPEAFTNLGYQEYAGLPLSVILTFVAAIGMYVILRHTRLGRYAYALGGNAEAARLSGVPVRLVQTAVFGLCGLLSGVAGLLLVARLSVASPTAGLNYELNAIAAVVIGGTSLMGGQGGVGGTLAGALIMGVLINGLDHLGVSPHWQPVAIGAIIILAVFIDYLRRRSR